MASKKKQQNLFSSTSNKLAEYEAKQQEHAKQYLRRKRDNKLALITGASVLVITLGSQFAYTSINPVPSESATPTTSSTPVAQETNGPLVPDVALAENRIWTGSMQVNAADLGIKLYGDKAPQATANFVSLTKKNFYKDVPCHRLTTSGIFVLQCGDPTGTGTGGPGYNFGPIENAPLADASGVATYKKGLLAMANSGGAYTNGSQFFIVYEDSPLMPNYTVFGEITSGLTDLNPIIQAGVSGGAGDGKPALETKLGTIKLN